MYPCHLFYLYYNLKKAHIPILIPEITLLGRKRPIWLLS